MSPLPWSDPAAIFTVGTPQLDASTAADPDPDVWVPIQGANPKAGTPRVPSQGSVTPSDSASSAWEVTYRLGWSWTTNGKKFRHDFAETQRTAGTGDYQAEAHAALIPDKYENPAAFSSYTDSCAKQDVRNATARTCQSRFFASGHGKTWVIVSGHHFDQGVNGNDGECSGCLDRQFKHP